MPVEQRSLTFFEFGFYTWKVGPVAASVTLRGTVDAELMDRAARLLQRDYPILRCSFRKTDDDVELVQAAEGPGLTVIEPVEHALANELNVALPDDRLVNRISLAQRGDTAVLSFAGDHAGSDARLNTLLLRRLLGYYGDLLRGVEPQPTGRSAFEGSLEESLLATYPEPGPVPPLTDGPSPLTLAGSATAPGPLGVHSFAFEQRRTKALITAAKKGGVSVTNLLTGAMACAIRARFAPGAGPLPVNAAFAVDLRPRVEPPIAPDAPYVCVARTVCAIEVDSTDNAFDAGRRISEQLLGALERNEIQNRILAQRIDRKPLPLPPMSFMVSNIGIIEDYPMPDGLEVVDTRWATTSRGPVATLFGSTAHGMLTLDLVYDTAFYSAEVIAETVKLFEAALETALEAVLVAAQG
jgi:hypothetical protein